MAVSRGRKRAIGIGMASQTRKKEYSLGFLGNTYTYQGTDVTSTIAILFLAKMIVKWTSKIH